MEPADKKFLHDLLMTPSPSGYEQQIQQVVRDFAKEFADDVRTDLHGNVIVAVNPEGSPRIMLAGHCDQIGLLVKNIDEKGFLWITPVGGWDPQILLGQSVQVWSESGPLTGAIARKPIHLLTQDERKQVPDVTDLWVDIGCRDEAQARELVKIGDPITVTLGPTEMMNDLMCGPAMDNKTGVWTVITAAKRAAAQNPKAAIFAVSTVQEEIGLRGAITSAFGVAPDLGIAVDVTHATDCPTIDPNKYGKIHLGKGPVLYRGANVNPRMFDRLQSLAGEHDVPLQVSAIARGASNDANALQISRQGVATGLVAIPNRYMHSPVEMISLTDIDHASNLIAAFCAGVTSDDDFTP